MKKAIKKKKTLKGLFAPSTVSKEDIAKAKKPVKKTTKTVAKPKAVKKPESSHPGLRKEVLDKIASGSKKKKGALKNPAKVDAERNDAITRAFEDYMSRLRAPRFGDIKIGDDGSDSHSDLRLAAYVVKKSKINPVRLIAKIKAGDEIVTSLIMECIAYNAWLWSNWCSRIWASTLQEEPPIRRVVGIQLHDLIPFADTEGVFDKLIVSMKKNAEVKKALQALGHCKTKVRLMPIITAKAKPATLYALNDLMVWKTLNGLASSYSIRGLIVRSSLMDLETLPRDICVVYVDEQQRKSMLSKFEEAAEYGFRVILSLDSLKGKLKSVKDIRASETYRKFQNTWGGLYPLITVPPASNMGLVSKVSKLGDILLI